MERTKLTFVDNWFDALNSLGVPTSVDPNDGLSAGGYFLPLSIDPNSQTRSDARTAYFDPVSSRGNLHVLANVPVTRILFDTANGLHATGVEVIKLSFQES
jgi:choline dehydrogenase-like flavoprotein